MSYIPHEDHLSALLSGARTLRPDTSLRARRLTAFHIVDYYQAILNESASILQLAATSDKLRELVNSLVAALPGLTGVDHLNELPDFRNKLSHDERWQPGHKQLDRLLQAAEGTRAALLKASNDVAEKRASMSELAVRLDQASKELGIALKTHEGSPKEKWTVKFVRARELMARPSGHLGIDAIDLLVEIRSHLTSIETEREIRSQEWEPEPDESYRYEDAEPNHDYEPPEPDYEPPEPDYEPPDQDRDDAPSNDPGDSDQEPPEPDHEPSEPDQEPRNRETDDEGSADE